MVLFRNIFLKAIMVIVYFSGEVSLPHDELFEKRSHALGELITSRKRLYEAEEHAIRVMMTEQASSELGLRLS